MCCSESFYWWSKCLDHQEIFSCFLEEADKCVRGGLEFVCELLFEVRPRRASELAVCTGLESPRACRCCGTEEWSIGIKHSGNPSCVEGGDVEQVCSNLETNPFCLRLLTLSLSLFVPCLYLAYYYCVYIYMLDILCAWLLYAWGLFANTCI